MPYSQTITIKASPTISSSIWRHLALAIGDQIVVVLLFIPFI